MSLVLVQPGSTVFDADGEQLGTVEGVSGDRFHLETRNADFWIPYDFILRAHAQTVLVNTYRADLQRFRNALSSRWARPA